MERIYAVPLPTTLAVGQLTKKMARTFFASMISPALNVGLGLLVQELLPPVGLIIKAMFALIMI